VPADLRAKDEELPEATPGKRVMRADSQRSLDALLQAAKRVFARSGVEAPVREIAAEAGVGVATLYRHFPQRSDLVIAIFRRELESCADAAEEYARTLPPWEALRKWMQRFVDFVSAKHGLAAALHSGDPAYEPLRDHFDLRLKPAMHRLLDSAVKSGDVRADVDAGELLSAIFSLCHPASDAKGWATARRMVDLLTDGLRVTR